MRQKREGEQVTASGDTAVRAPSGQSSTRGQAGLQKAWGQYVTPAHVADFMVHLISKGKSARVLDPCAGKGAFGAALTRAGYSTFEQLEIDAQLGRGIPGVKLGDFLLDDFESQFDVVIGNPPYVRWRNVPPPYRNRLLAAGRWQGRLSTLGDLLHPFILRAVEVLKQDGELIFIAPQFWMETLHAADLRRELAGSGFLSLLILLGEARVFPGVASTIAIFKFIKSSRRPEFDVVDASSVPSVTPEVLESVSRLLGQSEKGSTASEDEGILAYQHPQFVGGGIWKPLPPATRSHLENLESLCARNAPWVSYRSGHRIGKARVNSLFEREDLELLGIPEKQCTQVSLDRRAQFVVPALSRTLSSFDADSSDQPPPKKVVSRYVRLGDIMDIGNGLVSGLDSAFLVSDRTRFSREDEELMVRVVKARCLRRGYFEQPADYILANAIGSEDVLRKEHPAVFSHLSARVDSLKSRYSYSRDIPWWHWVFMRNYSLISEAPEMIVTPCKERFNLRGYLRFAYVPNGYLVTQDATALVRKPFVSEDLKFILGWLLSRQVYDWVVHKGFSRGGVQEFSEEPLRRIPVRLVDWSKRTEVAIHHKVVDEVTSMQQTHQEHPFIERVQSLLDELVPR